MSNQLYRRFMSLAPNEKIQVVINGVPVRIERSYHQMGFYFRLLLVNGYNRWFARDITEGLGQAILMILEIENA